jgi:hypothetical protein
MEQFATSITFQAKPSKLKKSIALIAFVAGAVTFTMAIMKVGNPGNGPIFFAGGLVAMAFAFRFWNMQVRVGPMAVTFDPHGITIGNRSSINTIPWPELAAIRYKATKGGHYWEFKARGRDQTIDYYLDGLTSAQQADLFAAITSIKLLGVLIQPIHDPVGLFSDDD